METGGAELDIAAAAVAASAGLTVGLAAAGGIAMGLGAEVGRGTAAEKDVAESCGGGCSLLWRNLWSLCLRVQQMTHTRDQILRLKRFANEFVGFYGEGFFRNRTVYNTRH